MLNWNIWNYFVLVISVISAIEVLIISKHNYINRVWLYCSRNPSNRFRHQFQVVLSDTYQFIQLNTIHWASTVLNNWFEKIVIIRWQLKKQIFTSLISVKVRSQNNTLNTPCSRLKIIHTLFYWSPSLLYVTRMRVKHLIGYDTNTKIYLKLLVFPVDSNFICKVHLSEH